MKKILFIYPSKYNINNKLIKKKFSFMPARSLPYLAALTPPKFDCRIMDESVEDINFNEECDLVALGGLLPNVPRAIDIARKYKERKKSVIIGGPGAYSVDKYIESSGCFDSIVLGEADDIWETVVDDFDQGQLKPKYVCGEPPELSKMPLPRYDLLNQDKYIKSFYKPRKIVISIETSRGCPHSCKFCLVTNYFGKKMRYRPISEVVDEIKFHGIKFFGFSDDNIAINYKRSEELFKALKPLNVKWLGQFDTNIIRKPELLKLAAESGCVRAFVGIESLNEENLKGVNKKHNTRHSFKDIAKAFKKANIEIVASLIFGLDSDTPDKINWTIDQMISNCMGTITPWILTPIPKTETYDELKKEGRLLHGNYSLFDGTNCVIHPKLMSPRELEDIYWKVYKKFYGLYPIFSRIKNGAKHSLVSTVLNNLHFRNRVYKKIHPFSS